VDRAAEVGYLRYMSTRRPLRIGLVVAVLASSMLSAGTASSQAKGGLRKETEGLPQPYIAALGKGEAAFAARDFTASVAAFQEAIKVDPARMLAFYRLGEAQRAAGKLEDADATWQSALNKKGSEELKGKVLAVIADLRERQKKWQAAKEGWSAYASHLSASKAHGYPATASERQKQAERRMKDEKDYGAVKERIAKREEEKTKEAEENAKKDKLNK
jgi:tetratricopeptide (TPR) repeat protein